MIFRLIYKNLKIGASLWQQIHVYSVTYCVKVCVDLLLVDFCVLSPALRSAVRFPGQALCFDWGVSPVCAGLNCTMEWWSKALCWPFGSAYWQHCNIMCSFWDNFLPTPYYPSCTFNLYGAEATRPARHSCGNYSFMSAGGNSEKGCFLSGLLLLLFMFLLPWYPWWSHEQRGLFQKDCNAHAAPSYTSGSGLPSV